MSDLEKNENEQVTNEAEPKEEPKEIKNNNSGSNFYKQKIDQLIQENEKFKLELEKEKTTKLQEKENFKELWEREKQKREEAETKAKKISESYFNGLKMSAIEQEALKAGILNEALSDIGIIDNSMVEIETTSTGNANVLGAKEFVESLKESKPHWFKKIGPPNINTSNPQENESPRDLTAKELVELEKKDPAKYRQEMMKKFKIAK